MLTRVVAENGVFASLASALRKFKRLKFLFLRFQSTASRVEEHRGLAEFFTELPTLPLTDFHLHGFEIPLEAFHTFRSAKQLPATWYVDGWSELEALGFDYSALRA